MRDLFLQRNTPAAPLAQRMRPKSLAEVTGQAHLLGATGALTRLLAAGFLPSLIFWGPPGTGKTTIARLLAVESKNRFVSLSAISSGAVDLREAISAAHMRRDLHAERTVLFVDEIHRWNKAQQDGLLPHVEDGSITLIGSTTENPSFHVIAPLLSRCKVYTLEPLGDDAIAQLVRRALTDCNRGLGAHDLTIADDALQLLIADCGGDARRALTTLDIAAQLQLQSKLGKHVISAESILHALQRRTLRYDRSGEEHYNLISAFIKSMRGSDPDAAVYYLARMLEAGEDPLFCARRMIIFASEDIGCANSQALLVANAAAQAFERIGMPEGWIPLAHAATFLACSPKSNASYMAYKKALADVREHGELPTPLNLRNAPTKLMKELGYGADYKYPHDVEGNVVPNEKYLPEKLQHRHYYKPTDNGAEAQIKQRLSHHKK